MFKRLSLWMALTLICCVSFYGHALSWNEERTHRDLSSFALDNSVLSQSQGDFLTNLGFNKGLDELLSLNGTILSIRLWAQDGAELEDASSSLFPLLGTTRSLNHFHNPLKPWNQAGLDDWYIGHWTGESSLVWAQDGSAQQNVVKGDWSWQKTRDYYYTALTSTTDSVRQENFAKTFSGLGHQMHLLQDTAEPDHTRNDAHPEDAMFGKNPFTGSAYFESWAKNNPVTINTFAASPIVPSVSLSVPINGYAPITQLYDTDTYNGTNPSTSLTQGLSEYTNANFFSNDTIFAAEIYQPSDRHYFPYPKKTSTDLQSFMAGSKAYETITAEDGTTDNGYWLSKTGDGETITHFLRAGYFTDIVYNAFGEGNLYHSTFYRDEKCHEDYASKLVPRAVGYSASLIDYFFRGSIGITVPSNGVYSLIDPTETEFTAIKLLAKNTTSTNEDMTNGTIQLVVKYKVAQADPFVSGPVATSADFSYIVVPEKANISSLSRSSYTELNFDLIGQNALPLWATDVYLQVVFKGTLGNETDAVAVGFKDIGEPTPFDMFNNMDMVCLNSTWFVAGSQAAINQVDTNHNGQADEDDVFAHDLTNINIRILPFGTAQYASPSIHNFVVPSLLAGHFLRSAYFLSDYQYYFSDYSTITAPDPNDHRSHSYTRVILSVESIKRQSDYIEGSGYVDYNPQFTTFRGLTVWGSGEVWDNAAYPAGSSCLYVNLP